MSTMHEAPESDLQRLLAEEPFVRALAQQLVVGDADEVVQQTWLQALQQGGEGVERPRHWLSRIVRNVAANLRRSERRRQQREHAAAAHELVPSSAELMLREERRRELVDAVDALPPQLRTVVLLRWFDGLPPRRIAMELGVPPATVSTQLRRALELLRQRLDRTHGGDRRAWLLPLVPFAVRPTGVPQLVGPGLPVLLTGVIAMTTKAKIVAAAVALLAAAGAWMLWPGDGPPFDSPQVADAQGSPRAAQAGGPQPAKPEAAAAVTPQRQLVPTPAVATTGSLVVHVRYGDDHAAAPGEMLCVYRPGSDSRFDAFRQQTDTAGAARFDGLPPGSLLVASNTEPGRRVEIEVGMVAELDLELDAGLTLTGIVVDSGGVPIAGALVEMGPFNKLDSCPQVIACTGGDGRFRARAAPAIGIACARADGHVASPGLFVFGKSGNTADVRLVLGDRGGSVDGLVLDPDGRPLAAAVVTIGDGQLSARAMANIPPFPAFVHSDQDGRFRAVGVGTGVQPVHVRARGFAPWSGSIEVGNGLCVPLRVTLGPGATLHGFVCDAEGAPVAKATVESGSWDDLAHYSTQTATDGSFELTGLAAGDLPLCARHSDLGKCTRTVHVVAGTTTECELPLSRGLELIGQVVDEDGKPVAGAHLQYVEDGRAQIVGTQTDADGRFAAANCPETGGVSLTIQARGFEMLRPPAIDPRAGEVVLRLHRAEVKNARITGTVLDPDGKPVVNAMVSAHREPPDSSGLHATDNDGHFEIDRLGAGAWRILVDTKTHPYYISEVRTLAAGATWAMGTITLAVGGTAVFHRNGDVGGASYSVTTTAGRRWGSVEEESGKLRSRVLAPDNYLLVVTGTGVAAQAVPFTIRAGQETAVEVQVRAGVLQRFECALPGGDANQNGVTLRITHGGGFVGNAWAKAQAGQATAAEFCLLPGDYELSAEAGELRGSAKFTVGATAGGTVRVDLH